MATAAADSFSLEPSETECPTCKDHFIIPKLLPCGHLYCRNCVVMWLNSQPEASCPTCRCPIVILEGDGIEQSSEQIADDLPTDLPMEALADAKRLLAKKNMMCVCAEAAAVSMCLTCDDMFCERCKKVHMRQAVSKHHRLEDMTSLTANTLASSRPIMCKNHNNKVAELHCPEHRVSVCGLCATVDHRRCSDVMTMETTLRKARAEHAEVMTAVSDGETDHAQVIGQLDEDLEEIDKRHQDTLLEVEETCRRLESAVQACRLRLNKMAEGARSDGKKQVQDGKSLLHSRMGKLILHKQALERSQQFSTHGFFPMMVSMVKERVDNLHRKATLPSDVVLMTLSIDPEVVSRIEKDLSQLGHLVLAAPLPNVENATFVFHTNHGKKVELSDDRQTAWRTSLDRWDGIVLSRDSMEENMLYQVVIEEINEGCHYTALGVVTQSPDTLNLPAFFTGEHPMALRVQPDGMYSFGEWKRNPKWPMLEDLPNNSKVGLALHKDSSLHLYLDDQHQGEVCHEVTQPCYFMFHLRSRCTKIRAFPVKIT